MKKTLLSAFVVTSFVFYSLSQRGQTGSVTGSGVIGTNISKSLTPTTAPTSTVSPKPTDSPTPTRMMSNSNMGQMGMMGYKDGSYTGPSKNAYYGYVQVSVIISDGKITDVQFLSYPNDRERSLLISQYAMPKLKSEAIRVQSANVNIVSGATDTSIAFRQSLSSALASAKL